MKRPALTLGLLLLAMLPAVLPAIAPARAAAADIFVRPGDSRGDGSREKPFRDPYLALDSANAGDVIHIARGTYNGRLDCGNWTAAAPNLTILGGYNDDFSARDPWKNLTILTASRNYSGPRESELLAGQGDHTALIVDGLVFDGAGENAYNDGPRGALKPSAITGELVNFSSPGVVIRNCTFVNGVNGAAVLRGQGSRFENNIVVNHVGTFLVKLDADQGNTQKPIIVKGNTLLFSWSADAAARGGEQGVGVLARSAAQIIDNVIAGCDNHGVGVFAPPDQVTLQGNVFFMNGKSNICLWSEGKEMTIDDANMDDLEDLGFKKSDANAVRDPDLHGLDKVWIDSYSAWINSFYPKSKHQSLQSLRKSAGLSGQSAAPAYPAASAASIVSGIAGKGAHPIALQAAIAPVAPRPPPREYAAAKWEAFAKGDRRLDGRRIELIIPTGNERNFYPFDSIKESDYIGVEIMAPTQQAADDLGQNLIAYLPRGSAVSRHWTSSANFGDDARSHLYRICGLAKSVSASGGRQTMTLIVESIAPFERPPIIKPRPAGHDWYVRAGSSGGDGSREKPFKDPWQALEKAERGDVIHLAAGDYFGKLKYGQWQIEQQFVALVGGYNENFTERNPWKNRTRFSCGPDAVKNGHNGTFFLASGDCEGLILDGLIFDGRVLNTYAPDGSLTPDPGRPAATLVQLSGKSVAVRNCTFLNSAGPALVISGGAGTVENNVIVNSHVSALDINLTDDRGAPWVIRHNTLLFAGDARPDAGTGDSATDGVMIGMVGNGPVNVQDNIISFADDYGLRMSPLAEDIRLTGNVMVLNLHAQYFNTTTILLDESTWNRRSDDAGFKECAGNVFTLPKLPIPRRYLQSYFARIAKLPSQYDRARLETLAAAAGVSLPALPASQPATPIASTAPANKTFSHSTSNLDSLMSGLDSVKSPQSAEHPKDTGVYAPVYDLDAAIALASTSDAPAGARQIKLDADFSPSNSPRGGLHGSVPHSPANHPTPTPQPIDPSAYRSIALSALSGRTGRLDGQKISITLQSGRLTLGGGHSWLDGLSLSEDDWIEVVVHPSDPAAPPLGVTVCLKRGTRLEKLIDGAHEQDSFVILGTARGVKNHHGICIVVDGIEKADER